MSVLEMGLISEAGRGKDMYHPEFSKQCWCNKQSIRQLKVGSLSVGSFQSGLLQTANCQLPTNTAE